MKEGLVKMLAAIGDYLAAQEARLTALEAQGSTQRETATSGPREPSNPVASRTEPPEPCPAWIDVETVKDVFNDLKNANRCCDPEKPDIVSARYHVRKALERIEQKLVPGGYRKYQEGI